jgi:hypothetical protein
MALFDKEKRQQKRDEKTREAASAQYDEVLQAWQEDMSRAEGYCELARDFGGASPADAAQAQVPLVAKKGELVFLHMPGAGLIEPRRLPGQWVGGYSGFSFRVMKGVSYRVGGTRGTYAQGAETQQMIDQGDAIVTNQRVVFLGSKQTREWAYSKLMGIQHDDKLGATYLQVSNRQKVSGIGYGPQVAQDVQFRLSLALAHFNGDVQPLVESLERTVRELRAQRPADPTTALPPPPPPS